jgi:hypothetical protein
MLQRAAFSQTRALHRDMLFSDGGSLLLCPFTCALCYLFRPAPAGSAPINI